MKKKTESGSWSPHARQHDLIVKRLDGELLIYDVERHRAHSLGPLLAALWRRCDGRTPPRALAEVLAAELDAPVGDELVWLGLEQLSAAHLLRDKAPARAGRRARSKPGSPTRRQWLRHAAGLGLAVVTITVPTLAEAATTISLGNCVARTPPNCGGTPCSGIFAGRTCVATRNGRRCFCR